VCAFDHKFLSMFIAFFFWQSLVLDAEGLIIYSANEICRYVSLHCMQHYVVTLVHAIG